MPPAASLEQIFEVHIQTLALTLRPGSVCAYRNAARRFLSYLRTHFPRLHRLRQLRRDPHLRGWFCSLCEEQPPLSPATRRLLLVCLGRLLQDLAAHGHGLAQHLIRREDFPPLPLYLPRPLSLADDQQLQQELRRSDDLLAWALLLTRATGIRIGECMDLPLDCLRQLGPDQWAVHVPLGKLHTERLVPADPDVCQIIDRILVLRAQVPSAHLANSAGLLLPRSTGRCCFFQKLSSSLADAAVRAHCSGPVTSHRLRHTFASEMLRHGVSLPALMQLLGHKDIRMTLRYVQVTQHDLHREFHTARSRAAQPHSVPVLSVPNPSTAAGLPGIRTALTATRHLLEMFRRQLGDEKARRTLSRLDRRLLAVASQLDRLASSEK